MSETVKTFRLIRNLLMYEMPKAFVNYRKPRRLSAEQREAARERANNLHNIGEKAVN